MTYINFDINKGFKNFIYEGSANNATLNIGFAPDFINYTISETEGGFNAYSMLGSGLLKGDDDGFVSADANAHKHMTANGAIIGNSSKVNIHNHQCHATAWNAGGNNQVVNSTGTITANVCANTTTGFSTGTYTGNQSDTQTIGHGLSKKPELVWVQAVDGDDGGDSPWQISTKNTALDNPQKFFYGGARSGSGIGTSANHFPALPTSSVFTIGNSTEVNKSGRKYVFRCWHSVKGFCKIGEYVTNNFHGGGAFIYCGFRPAIVQIKLIGNGSLTVYKQGMHLTDTQGHGFSNGVLEDYSYSWQGGSAEGNANMIHIYSNGFKILGNNNSTAGRNSSLDLTYTYVAWAGQSLVTQNNLPCNGV